MTKQTQRFETVAFTAGDGMKLNLQHAIGIEQPTKCPVLLVHGAGVRANIFNAPLTTSIIDFLLGQGYDVWLENWRASIEFEANPWSLDQAAVYDHPKAVDKIIQITGAESIKAIIHCQGSTSFMMSAIAGLVPQVDTIISNAVSLHPVVPKLSQFKINLAPPIVRLFTDYLDPIRSIENPGLLDKLLKLYVQTTHRECKSFVCRYTSFMYGTGHPTLWRHENLNSETHNWLSHEFGFLPVSFFRQIGESIHQGHLIPSDNMVELPIDLISCTPQTHARIAFFAGKQNQCFLPESQQQSFDYFNRLQPDFHSLHLIENYGHLCMFMGKNAAKDVFPLMLQELEKT